MAGEGAKALACLSASTIASNFHTTFTLPRYPYSSYLIAQIPQFCLLPGQLELKVQTSARKINWYDQLRSRLPHVSPTLLFPNLRLKIEAEADT
jgi:hypothetical protein